MVGKSIFQYYFLQILTIVPLAFFTTTAYGVFSFIRLARKWPKLMQHWEFVEAILPPYRTYEERKVLGRKIRNVSVIVLSVSNQHWSVWTVKLGQCSRSSLKPMKTMIKIALFRFVCHLNYHEHTKEIHERPSERYNYIKPFAEDGLPPCELSQSENKRNLNIEQCFQWIIIFAQSFHYYWHHVHNMFNCQNRKKAFS